MKLMVDISVTVGLLQFFVLLWSSLLASCQNAVRKESTLFTTEWSILSPCEACKALTTSFAKGVDETEWEAKRPGGYANPEARLVDIRERLCEGLERGEAQQCHQLADDTERTVEEWWFHRRTEEPDLYAYLCVESIRACCPARHFGPECKPCDRCSGNGDCEGSGTREGSGRCICDVGYAGIKCDVCATGSYESYRDADKLLCSLCHFSCAGACKGAGPEGCGECRDGWIMEGGGKGCRDVDECSLHPDQSCRPQEFCVNTEGLFACFACDAACNGCHGDGPDECDRCADGYVLHDNVCIDASTLGREAHVSTARYATYFGLCLATCIVFQKSAAVAGIVGLSVALYISVSEYILSSQQPGETKSEFESLLVPTS